MKTKNKRIGPRMLQALTFATQHPGKTTYDFAKAYLYHGRVSTKFSYAVMHRAFIAGLVTYGPSLSGRGAGVYPAETL